MNKLISLFAALILMLAGGHAANDAVNAPSVPAGALVSAMYTCSGDEFGNTYTAEIKSTANGALELTVNRQDYWHEPMTLQRYSIASNTLERISATVNEYGMDQWGNRPDFYDVCDAAHPYLHLVIMDIDGNERNVSISGYIDFTDAEREAWNTVRDLILDGASGEPINDKQLTVE